MKHLWDEREPSLKLKEDGMLTGDCGGEERGIVKTRNQGWNEQRLDLVEEFYFFPTSKPLPVFYFPVFFTTICCTERHCLSYKHLLLYC